MPEGGKLWIETCHASPPDEPGATDGTDYVALCVRDSGRGMPPEVASRAFEPFFTTKPLGMGTGLGLSMIYGFIRQSGGQVRIESRAGEGTAVWLYLPRDAGQAHAPEVPAAAPMEHRGQGQTVLVVDDEASIRGLVSEVLDQSGYVALEACDGASGLRILESNLPVDLLITDVGMPGGLSGPQMVARARLVRPQLKVLFITGYAEQALTAEGPLGEGMYSMSKPFSLQALSERIRQLLES
ncbi:response regulator [Pseudomonas sp. KNUC1026]|uniref:response regulator n=1 Tax=Pseudomonas sp. KNUC1026 TaxID=2893890 RepID=UPI001F186D95|nr:response regulator [Pseudomonas sp. KNUC1026]UFH50994.1 response regulator [Pseudomonas sp. KNUC1026]